jgi:predicted membrane metal-binding protein
LNSFNTGSSPVFQDLLPPLNTIKASQVTRRPKCLREIIRNLLHQQVYSHFWPEQQRLGAALSVGAQRKNRAQ